MSARAGRPLGRRAALGALPALGLSACGFQPVYMPAASGGPGPVERDLAAVNVPPIPDRPGQLLRQALQARLNSDGGAQRRYDLDVVYWIAGDGIALLPDTSVTRLRLTGYANWALRSADAARARLTQGAARAIDATNVFDQQYFALDMQNDAVQRRLAENVADQIAMQLATWFRARASKAEG